MLKLKNVVVLLNSATPYNCLTKCSRVVNPDVSKACNPLKLGATDPDPTSNVMRWRPDEEGRYRSIDFYVNSIAFRVPSGCNRLSITIAMGDEETEYEVPLFEECVRFGSMKAVAEYVTGKLHVKEAPRQADLREGGHGMAILLQAHRCEDELLSKAPQLGR